MNQSIDPRVAAWLEEGPDRGPQEGLERALAATRTVSQRPTWTFPGRWLPSPMGQWHGAAPRQVMLLALVTLLTLALGLAALTVGALRRTPPPFGLAANGLVTFDRDGKIVAAKPDGTDVIDLVTSVADARGPVFSPDGNWIAFYGRADGTVSILVTTPDGRDPVVVSSGINLEGATETPPSWSPDSTRLAFNGKTVEGLGIFIGSVDGRDPIQIGDPGLSRADPSWSPDGEWIAFQGRRPEEQVGIVEYRMLGGLYIIHPDGTGQEELTRGAGGSFTYAKPQWRPDPSAPMLAYSVGEPGYYNIAVFDLKTRQQTIISALPAAETWPVWSPDGSLLAWDASDSMIRMARLDGTIVREFRTPLNYAFSWSPDGNYLLGWARETSDTRLRMRILPLDPSAQPVDIPLNGVSQSHWSWQRLAR